MKKKIIISVVAILVALLLIVDIAGANFLVSFAIGRSTAGGEAVVPTPSTSDATRDIVQENARRITEETLSWMEQISPETVSITSADGLKLSGESCVLDAGSHKWAILIHGYTANHNMMWSYGKLFAEEGYNLLLPDMRGHGESEGDYIGMGWLDRKDVLQWIDFVCQQDAEAEIVLLGVSMGGATVMMTSGEDLPGNVKAIVEDCGYTSVWDIFSDEMKVLFHLPNFPLLHTASVISTLRAGYNFTEASALDQLAKAKVPILFIHGGEDNFVHAEMVYVNYEACPTQKDIFVVENAGHAQSYFYAPDEYAEHVFTFLNSVQ